MDKSLKRISKFLSLVLRHQPDVIGIALDEGGWVDVATLIEAANRHGNDLNLETVHRVVAENDKQRFSFDEDGLRIRANQGHSLPNVDLDLEPVAPPAMLFHGTVAAFLDSIRKTGLEKRSRNHVHLSADAETARNVGSRRGKPILLQVDAARMHTNGHRFFLSANGVWLTERVPAEYLDLD